MRKLSVLGGQNNTAQLQCVGCGLTARLCRAGRALRSGAATRAGSACDGPAALVSMLVLLCVLAVPPRASHHGEGPVTVNSFMERLLSVHSGWND